VEALQARSGVMTLQDLANHKTLALEPISTRYRWVRATKANKQISQQENKTPRLYVWG
jgi:gamma-glutamyltranspeptidase